MDYSAKLKLAAVMHPELEIYSALGLIDQWLADHEHDGVADLTIKVSCPCGDTVLERTLQEFEDDPDLKPQCRCLNEDWYLMECGDCKHTYSIPEHQVETAVCPKCSKVGQPYRS